MLCFVLVSSTTLTPQWGTRSMKFPCILRPTFLLPHSKVVRFPLTLAVENSRAPLKRRMCILLGREELTTTT